MRGPNGEWRPAGISALAVHICKIATGEIEETYEAAGGYRGSRKPLRRLAPEAWLAPRN